MADEIIGPPGPETKPPAPQIGTAAWLAWRQAQRAQQLQDGAASARARVAAAPAPTAPPRRAVPSYEAMAAAEAATKTEQRAASGVEVVNPKIWDADLHGLRSKPSTTDTDSWLRRVRLAADRRTSGDPLRPFIVRAGELFVSIVRRDGRGIARATFKQLAKGIGCCKETARKVVRFLEAAGALDTFNVLTRAAPAGTYHAGTWRDANCYVLAGPDPAEAADRPAGLVDRIATRLTRYAAAFGLSPRQWGYNASATPPGVRHNPRLVRRD